MQKENNVTTSNIKKKNYKIVISNYLTMSWYRLFLCAFFCEVALDFMRINVQVQWYVFYRKNYVDFPPNGLTKSCIFWLKLCLACQPSSICLCLSNITNDLVFPILICYEIYSYFCSFLLHGSLGSFFLWSSLNCSVATETTRHFLPWVAVKSEPKQASRILPVRFTFAFVEPLPFFFLFFWPRKYN